jgi:hypothetical protein
MPLAFPSGKLPEAREIQFCDGPRVVPEYLADLLVGLDTIRYTYDEAVGRVNNRLSADHANRAVDSIVQNHFKGGLG